MYEIIVHIDIHEAKITKLAHDLVKYFTGTLVINVGHKREGGDLEQN